VKEADMRVALRILASATMALSALALGLLAWTWLATLPGTDVRALLAGPVGVLAFLLGIATVVVELVATEQHRDAVRRWFLVVGLAAIVVPFLLLLVIPLALAVSVFRVCQNLEAHASVCHPTGWQVVVVNAPLWLFIASPFVVGLVAWLASFRLRANSPAGPHPEETSPGD
jgi:hypothetical protein